MKVAKPDRGSPQIKHEFPGLAENGCVIRHELNLRGIEANRQQLAEDRDGGGAQDMPQIQFGKEG